MWSNYYDFLIATTCGLHILGFILFRNREINAPIRSSHTLLSLSSLSVSLVTLEYFAILLNFN